MEGGLIYNKWRAALLSVCDSTETRDWAHSLKKNSLSVRLDLKLCFYDEDLPLKARVVCIVAEV